MDRLDMLRTFVAVAEHESFSAAARRLNVSASAVSRAIASLEAGLGSALLRRTTRSVRLTELGTVYLARCRSALGELDNAALEIQGRGAGPRGTIVVTAPAAFGRHHVTPIIARLMRAHAELSVRLLLVDRVVRLVDEGVDVAIRIGDLADSSAISVKVAVVRRVLVASPDYLARRGVPGDPSALREHDLISFTGTDQHSEWRFGARSSQAVRIEPRIVANSAELAIDAAIQGLGISRILSYQAIEGVSTGKLVLLLDDMAPAPMPVHLLFQESRGLSPNVRAFVDEARVHFGATSLNI
jgi:DNA-binding transcriptional LysR family regulator